MIKKEPVVINVRLTFKKDGSEGGHISYFDLAGGEHKVEFSNLEEGQEVAWRMSLPGPDRKITSAENDFLYRLFRDKIRERKPIKSAFKPAFGKVTLSPGGIFIPC